METQPIAAVEAEQQWIAKYRRAIEANTAVPHSRSWFLSKPIMNTLAKALSSIGGRIEQCVHRAISEHRTGPKHRATQIGHAKLRPRTANHASDNWQIRA